MNTVKKLMRAMLVYMSSSCTKMLLYLGKSLGKCNLGRMECAK